MDELKQEFVAEETKFVTEDVVRAIIATSLNQFTESAILRSGYIQSNNFLSGVSGWKIDAEGNAYFNTLTLTGGTIKYGKTSFTDSTHAGYYMGAEGIYFGGATDATKLKFDISTGALDYVGTVSGRSTVTLAAAIDAAGHFADSAISTATSTILGAFTFGVSGALQIGTYVNGVSGDIRISPTGILGRDINGATTFSINGTTGVAVLNGLVVGTNVGLGTAQDSAGVTVIIGNTVTTSFINALNITAKYVEASISITSPLITGGTIDGGDVYANNFRYKKNTFQYLLGNVNIADGGWTYTPSTGSTLTGLGTNQMSLSLASASVEESYVISQGYGIILGGTGANAVEWNYDPSNEVWIKLTIAGTYPFSRVRMGNTPGNTESYVGWVFQVVDGVIRPIVKGYNPGGPEGATATTITSVDASKWHKYRIEVTKTSANHYTIVWYIDDTAVSTQYFTSEWTTTTSSFSVYITNNRADAAETINIQLAHAQFQQKYS